MYNSKKVNKTMKKIYQTPAMEVYATEMECILDQTSPGVTLNSVRKADANEVTYSNTRRTPNEDGLRDWDINLW